MKNKLIISKRLRIVSNALAAHTSNFKEKIAKLNIFKRQRSAANAPVVGGEVNGNIGHDRVQEPQPTNDSGAPHLSLVVL
ncbi:hypothetical protein H0H92_012065 [Tricholoma furcatifolium]|nr:hypothetical protein H0H92_012065 [Tricholoma furcatifolium]